MYCYALKINIYTQKFGFINPKTKMGVYSLNFFFLVTFYTYFTFGEHTFEITKMHLFAKQEFHE